MTGTDARVCPRCGEPAGEAAVCLSCGTNLAAMREMLPTRADWEAANPAGAGAPPPEPGGAPQPARRSRWARMTNRQRQTIVSLAVIALFAVVLIAGQGGSKKPSTPAAGVTTPSTAAATTNTTTKTTTTTPAATTGNPTVSSCAAAWNGGKSARHRRDLLGPVARASQAGAVIAVYEGPHQEVARVGGGNPVLVNMHACVIAVDDLVFVHQPDGSWGFSKASRAQFARIAGDPTWTAAHANATVQLGSTAAAGIVVPRGGSLVILTRADVQAAS